MKTCIKCLIKKELTDFPVMKCNKDGVREKCRECYPNAYKNKPQKQISYIEGEIWQDVVGYEGLYKVSNLGRVKGLEKKITQSTGGWYIKSERLMCHIKHHNGYIVIGLTKDKKCKNIELHRIIAKSFIKNPNNLPEVNHINLIRDDNRIENLEWVTCRENVAHGVRMTKKYSKHVGVHKLKYKWAAYCSINGENKWLGNFKTEIEAATKYNEELEQYGIENRYKNILT